MFKIKKVKPLFTGIITTAKRYVGDVTTEGGLLLDTTRLNGSINPYQTVIAVGPICKSVAEKNIVKINFSRYLKAKHVPGKIDEAENKQFDNLSATYEIPMIVIDGQECLLLQENDVEYIVEDYEIDEGGLLQ